MWPTFYIPGGGVTTAPFTYSCGQYEGSVSSKQLSYDSGTAAVGSLEVIVVAWDYTTGSGHSATYPVTSGNGWKILYDSHSPYSYLESTAGRYMVIAWRFKESGHGPFDLTISGGNACLTWSLYAFSDADTTDPFGLAIVGNGGFQGTYGRASALMDFRIGGAGNVLLSAAPRTRHVTGALNDWPAAGDPEFEARCYSLQNGTGGDYYTTRLVWEPSSTAMLNNKLLSSETNVSNWTASLVNLVAGPTATFASDTQFTANWGRMGHSSTASGAHEVYQDVSLESGKIYCFWGFIAHQASVRPYFAYNKPDASTHGAIAPITYGPNLADWDTGFVGTEIDENSCFYSTRELNGYSSNRRAAVFGIYIQADTTGTYRLRYGLTDSASSLSCTGNTGYVTGVDFLACTEVPSLFHLPAYVKTTGSAVTGATGVFSMTQMVTEVNGYAPPAQVALEIRKAGSTYQDAYLVMPWALGFTHRGLNDARLANTTTEQFYFQEITGCYTTPCSRVNYDGGQNGAKKWYFEFTLGSLGSLGADGDPHVAFGVSCGLGGPHGSTASGGVVAYQFGDLAGEFSWNSDGKFGEDGTFTTVDTNLAWVTTTVMGCGVDIENKTVKFYEDGVVVKTITIPDAYLTQAWQPHVTIIGQNLSTSQYRFTCNFKGPFSYQPTGYVAWDWANEA